MGFDEEQRRPTSASTDVDPAPAPRPVPGKQTVTGAETTPGAQAPTSVQTAPKTTDPEARIAQLIALLEKQFVRNSGLAKQTATTLSAEFPDKFDGAWLLEMFRRIDDAAWRKTMMASVHAKWDDRPGEAKSAIAQLLAKYKKDAQLKRWAAAMIKQIDRHQLRLTLERDLKNWDRAPSPAEQAAIRLNQLWPKSYGSKWLAGIRARIWSFQDVKWAEKINESELRTALGENAIDWNDAPDEVKQELQIRLGRQKAAQSFGPGGKGANDTAELVQTEASRTAALDQAALAKPEGSSFTWSNKEQRGVKRLDLVANAYDQESTKVAGLVTPVADPKQQNIFSAQQPDVFLTILNRSLEQYAEQLRERGQAYRNLKSRIDRGETTVAREHQLMEADINAMFDQRRNLSAEQAAFQREAAKDPKAAENAAKVQKAIDSLNNQITAVRAAIANGDVIPGAGQLAEKYPPASVGPVTNAAVSQVNRDMNYIDRVTTGDDPSYQGVGKNVNEMAVGLYRLQGRITTFHAGVMAVIADLGAKVLPESWSKPVLDLAEQLKQTAFAQSNANTQLTARQEGLQQQYTNAGGELPMIDRVFSTQKIFEKPDVALLAILQATPGAKPVALALQVGISGIQVIESFFAEYSKSRSLDKAIKVAGWGALSSTIGIVLDKLGIPPAAGLVANLTMIVGFGKLRGLSNAQIQEEVAYALVGAAIGAATNRLKPGAASPVRDVPDQARAIVEGADGAIAKTGDADPTPKDAVDPVKQQKIEQVVTELATAMVESRKVTLQLQEAQKNGTSQKEPLAQLKQSVEITTQKRKELKLLTAGEGGQTIQKTAAGVTPIVPTKTGATVIKKAPQKPGTALMVVPKKLPAAPAAITDKTPASPAVLAPWLPKKSAAILKAALEAGPNTWTSTGNKPTGDIPFQRGLTGDYTKGQGVKEAQSLLSGKTDTDKRYVTVYGDDTSLKTSDQATTEVTSQYADPMAVRGKLPTVAERGDTTARAENLSLANVESLAFLPNRGQPYRWAKSMLELVKSSGVTVDPASRGGKFLADLQDVLIKKPKWGEDDGFGRPLENSDEVDAALTEVFDAYAKPPEK